MDKIKLKLFRKNCLKKIKNNILIIIPSLSVGGGNYWAKILIEHFKYFDCRIVICICYDQFEKFFMFDNIKVISYKKDYINYDQYSIIISTVKLNLDLSKINKEKLFGFTQSDISWVNEYFFNNFSNVICLNLTTYNKFISRGFNKNLFILNNYLEIINDDVNCRVFNKKEIKILYCNRISQDKNVIMVLHAIKLISLKYNIILTILAGDIENCKLEIDFINKTIDYLCIKNIVNILPTQKNVEEYYNSNDFCFLLSVSEGCSYGILEAINHEIPFVYTDIDSNNEIINNSLPSVNFINNKKLLSTRFCVKNYNELISNLGYIYIDELNNLNLPVELINYILYKESNELKFGIFYEPNQMNYLVQNMKYQPNNYDFNINNFDIEDLENLIEKKKIIFGKNVNNIEMKFLELIDNYENCKNNVIKLKQKIRKIYFSEIYIRKQLLDIFKLVD